MNGRVLKWSVPVDDQWHPIGAGQVLHVECQQVANTVQVWTLEAPGHGDAAAFLRASESSPAGVNVTAAASTHPLPPSEGRPMTGAPLDADEVVPAPAGSPTANDSTGIPPEPPSDARGFDLTASEGGEAVREVRESAGPGGAQ